MEPIEESIKNFFSRDNWASSSTIEDLKSVLKYDAFYCTDNHSLNDSTNTRLLEFAKIFIAGEEGEFNQFKTKLKSYDFSSSCGLVWTTNYFAYRCRTCSLAPSMSLCSTCFNNGNHIGHDFNKFKSQAGGACDCGNSNVMKEIGYCKHHGPSKLSQQRDPPKSLINRLELIMPLYMRCVLFSCWSLIKNVDMDDNSFTLSNGGMGNSSDVLVTALSFINDLLSCGWVVQKLFANIMIDENEFAKFLHDVKDTDQYYIYYAALKSDPGFKFPEDKIRSTTLTHKSLVDAFLFVCVKLRFPENLITFLIGLLTVETYKDKFVHSYLNHYSRMASTILIHAKTVRNGHDYSYNMNNRIVHISVQLFSGETIALKMVKERQLHYLIVHCLLNMFYTALTRLDSRDNNVINCETPMIQNNVFWPLISDLTSLVTHKSVVNHFISDIEFMHDWIKLLKLMQFMNFFVLKEGSHIEYETMAFFHAYTMEIEISSNSMWNIWYHYRNKDDRDNTLKLVQIFVGSLANFLKNLGKFRTSVAPHPLRQPLSFHLPLMRNVACFVSLGLVYHDIPIDTLLNTITPKQIQRWFKETINTLLGCQEVLIGYWVRNGQSVRTSTTYYIHSQFCYALIDMDIFSAQICTSRLPGRHIIYVLADPTQLLKGIDFNSKIIASTKTNKENQQYPKSGIGAILFNIPQIIPISTTPKNVSSNTFVTTNTPSLQQQPQQLQQQSQQISNTHRNRSEKFNLEKQPLALESWLINLCWILDLRNEMTIDDRAKLRKEVCCELCPEPVKRSDLSHRLPEKTGIHVQISSDVDSILKEVANYTAPTFDEYSGNLQSGLYAFKPELWDTDYDPLFQSLRSVTKRDAADALSKYREHYRQTQNIAQANSLWPPYRKPPPPHPQLASLENLLHCRDLTYILFCCLNMFINNDPVVTEDSLALVIHILQRSIQIKQPQQPLDDGTKTRFPNNPFKQNNAVINLRQIVGFYPNYTENVDTTRFSHKPSSVESETGATSLTHFDSDSDDDNDYEIDGKSSQQNPTSRTVPHIEPIQYESILSLLLKVHSKLHSLRIQSGGKSLLSTKVTSKILKFNPVSSNYQLQENITLRSDDAMETSECNIIHKACVGEIGAMTSCSDGGGGVGGGGGGTQQNNENNDENDQINLIRSDQLDWSALTFFSSYPLVYEYSEENLQRSIETGVGINWGDGVDFVGHLLDLIVSREDENSRALFGLIDFVQQQTQKSTININQTMGKDSQDGSSEGGLQKIDEAEMKTPSTLIMETIQEKKQKALERRRRVIANMALKQKEFAKTHQIYMNDLDMSTSENEEQMYECVICQIRSNPVKQKMVLLGLLCSSEALKFMSHQPDSSNTGSLKQITRRTYCQNLNMNLPILSHGMIIQTCGHVVHLDCFDKYKAQRPAVTRMRRTITCPLCRRDVHHLTPISGVRPDKPPRRPSIISESTTGTSVSEAVSLSLLDSLKQTLILIYHTPSNSFADNIIEETISKNQSTRLLLFNQSCCLMRSQMELEVVICLTCPDQYCTVTKRCNFPEFIAYNRTLNKNIDSVIYQSDFLLGTQFSNELPNHDTDSEFNFTLIQTPADILLNFVPYIWPYVDWYSIILKSTLLLAYVKSLVVILNKLSSVEHTYWSQPITNEDNEFNKHLKLVLQRWSQLQNKSLDQTEIMDTSPPNTISPHSPLESDINTTNIELYGLSTEPIAVFIDQMLPLLRIGAVLRLRMMSVTRIPDDFPIQPISENQDKFKEFESLCVYLDLLQPSISSANHKPLDKIIQLISTCRSVTLYPTISDLIDKLITPDFIDFYETQKHDNGMNIDILNLGTELMPPRLIELPNCYDDLFNLYHSQKCTKNTKPSAHNFPENGLCLICGQLICLICDTMPVAFNDHAKSCCYGIGLVIDINTSIIHVLLNNEISQWGSVYLDYYGEEDLELKRGRPLFINSKRLKLLEQQWLSHSFKHVVKTWRRIS